MCTSQRMRYDPTANSWSTVASMPTGRDGLAAISHGSKIYAIGGITGSTKLSVVEAYDPAANSWSTVAPMPTARGVAAALNGDTIYVVGGNNGASVLHGRGVRPDRERVDDRHLHVGGTE